LLTILPSRDAFTIAVEFSGQATKEDAMLLDNEVGQRFKEKQKFNILAIMHEVDGSTFKGVTEGLKFDAKRWLQFNKFAVVSEKTWLEALTQLGTFLPGIVAKHFEKDELEEAWTWIQKVKDSK